MFEGPDEDVMELQDAFYAEMRDKDGGSDCNPPGWDDDLPLDEGIDMMDAVEAETASTSDTNGKRMKRIRRKDVFLRLQTSDPKQVLNEVRKLANDKLWDFVMLSDRQKGDTFYVGLHSKKADRVDIRKGLDYLERMIPSATGVWDTSPLKHTMTSRRQFARMAFPMGLDRKDIVGQSDGTYFSLTALSRFQSKLSDILDSDIPITKLLHQKKIKLSQVGHVQRARKVAEMEEQQESGRPDMTEPIVIEYNKRDHHGRIIPGGITKKVKVTPHPGETDVKKRHYYVYSSRANMGKTRSTELAFEKYSSAAVSDCHNAANVERGVQWLLIDEYGRTKNKMFEFNQLKAICGGGGNNHGFINIKSYDSSYIPRSDVQLFITSNVHPFAVYSSKLGQQISKSDADTFRARFHIICLDGNEEDDALAYVDIEEMSNAMYIRNMRNRFYKMLGAVMESKVVTNQDVSLAISRLWELHKTRYQNQILNTKHFEAIFPQFIEPDDVDTVMDIFNQNRCLHSFHMPDNFDPHRRITLKGRRQGLIDDYLE